MEGTESICIDALGDLSLALTDGMAAPLLLFLKFVFSKFLHINSSSFFLLLSNFCFILGYKLSGVEQLFSTMLNGGLLLKVASLLDSKHSRDVKV